MKKIFRRRSVRILLLSILILIGVLCYTVSTGGYSSLSSSIVNGIISPIQTFLTNGIRAIGIQRENKDERIVALNKKISELEQQLAEKNNEVSDYYQMKKENEQYRQYLGLKSEHPDYEFASASVIARDSNEMYGGFTINKGSLSGIEINDVVITSLGLVGKVTSLGATYAKVTTILSPKLNIGAFCCQTEEIGIVSGDLILADRGKTKVTQLAADTKITEGNLVATAGLGGIFPKNLTIGTVESVQRSSSDISMEAVLVPAVDITEVTDVFIITSFLGQGESVDGLSVGE